MVLALSLKSIILFGRSGVGGQAIKFRGSIKPRLSQLQQGCADTIVTGFARPFHALFSHRAIVFRSFHGTPPSERERTRVRMGVDRHNALLAITGGSATELSATDAWAEPLPVIKVNVWASLYVP